MGATSDGDRSLRDFEMFGEKLNKCSISLAVVGRGVQIDCECAVGPGDDFFLRAARLDSNRIRRHTYIIHRGIIRAYAKIQISVQISAYW